MDKLQSPKPKPSLNFNLSSSLTEGDINVNIMKNLEITLIKDLKESKDKCEELRIKNKMLEDRKNAIQAKLDFCMKQFSDLRTEIMEKQSKDVKKACDQLKLYQNQIVHLKTQAPKVTSNHLMVENLERSRNENILKVEAIKKDLNDLNDNLESVLRDIAIANDKKNRQLALLEKNQLQENEELGKHFEATRSRIINFEESVEQLIKISNLIRNQI